MSKKSKIYQLKVADPADPLKSYLPRNPIIIARADSIVYYFREKVLIDFI